MRLLSFGCSFTNYKWPTWADILGCEFDEFYNYGMAGGGNLFIFDSLVEAIATHNINEKDTVAIMWTNVTRDDRYSENFGGWLRYGNLFTSEGYHSTDFIDKFITVRGCYVRDMPLIHAAYKLLKSIGCRFYFLSMVDIDMHDQYKITKAQNIEDVLNTYQESLSVIKPSIYKTIFNYKWDSRGKKNDPHPHPIDHLAYVEKILPEFNLRPETKQWVIDIDTKLKNNIDITWKNMKVKRL